MDFLLKIILIVLAIVVLIIAIYFIIRSQRKGDSKRRLLAIAARNRRAQPQPQPTPDGENNNTSNDVESFSFGSSYLQKNSSEADVDGTISDYVKDYITAATSLINDES